MSCEIVELLAAHHWGDDTAVVGRVAMQCGCGWRASDAASRIYDLRARHDQHRAAALADLLAARDRRARGEALREAAGEWPGTQVARRPIAHWLRDRADRIDPTQSAAATEENRP